MRNNAAPPGGGVLLVLKPNQHKAGEKKSTFVVISHGSVFSKEYVLLSIIHIVHSNYG